jgi:Tol biopolymer transport system component
MIPAIHASRRVRSTSFQALALSLLVGCGGDSPVAPSADLSIIVKTDGAPVDADGYTVAIADNSYLTLSANTTITVKDLQSGIRTITLGGIAPNCFVSGENPRSVLIKSGQPSTVTFEISCIGVPGSSDRIAFMTNRDDPTANPIQYEVYVLNGDGSAARLTNNHFFDGFPSFSPDGQKIAFLSDRDGSHNIYVMNQDGSGVVRVTTTPLPAEDRYATWSPDGTKLLFISNRTGSSEIFVMNSDGSNVVQLTSNVGGDDQPRFSGDGTKIVFTSNRDAPNPGSGNGPWEIYQMNADGTGVVRLTHDNAIAEWPAYSPDGSRIVYDSDRLGEYDLYMMSPDGSGSTPLTTTAFPEYRGMWTADSRVLFNSFSSGTWEINRMSSDGSGVENLTRPAANVTNIAWSYYHQ